MAAEFRHTKEFREARFEDADLFGAKFRDCDLRGVKIVDSFLMDVNISGLIRNFRVNDVDVTAYVEGELDRRHPERVQARSLRAVHELRAMWDVIERLWAGTTERVERLPEGLRDERVDDEWSFVETQRHLVFCTDAWASRTVLDEEMPYDRLGYTHSSYPPEDAAALGIDLAAKPPYEDVMAVRADGWR
jgi:DinB superfamily/Pentapeptide repeats (8 copies)